MVVVVGKLGKLDNSLHHREAECLTPGFPFLGRCAHFPSFHLRLLATLSTFPNSSFLAATPSCAGKYLENEQSLVKWASWPESGLVQGMRGGWGGGGGLVGDGTMKET